MDNQYKVEFLSTRDKKGKMKINSPVDEIDLKYRLEALLVDKFKDGYKFVQMIESKRVNSMNAQDESGLVIIVEKIKQVEKE